MGFRICRQSRNDSFLGPWGLLFIEYLPRVSLCIGHISHVACFIRWAAETYIRFLWVSLGGRQSPGFQLGKQIEQDAPSLVILEYSGYGHEAQDSSA